jgi:membrane fusion protein (multidrug efflux system)
MRALPKPRKHLRATSLTFGSLALSALLAQLLPACAPGGDAETPPAPPRNVRVMTLAPTTLTEYFAMSGPVFPVRGTDISAEESGTVWAIPHDKGERVKAGDVLVELDRRQLAAERESARSSLELQDYSVDKVRRLFEAGKISRQELLAAEALYEQALAQSRIADLRHDRAAVKAPFAGLVADRYVELGQLVAAGTPVARVIDPFTLKLQGSLTEEEVRWLREGAPTEVRLDGYDKPLPGVVHWVGFEADPKNGKFKVEIHIDNQDLALRAGVVGRAQVLKQVHRNVLAVPRDAIVSHRQGVSVYVVEGDSAVVRPVQLGPDQGLMVVVTEGLQAGEKLVVRGQRDLVPGVKVRVTEEASAPDGSIGEDPRVVQAASPESWTGAGREEGE